MMNMVKDISVIMMLFHFLKEIAGDVWAPIPRCLDQILQCYNTKTSRILMAIMMMMTDDGDDHDHGDDGYGYDDEDDDDDDSDDRDNDDFSHNFVTGVWRLCASTKTLHRR